MTTQSQSEACPSCGAEVVGGRTFCWLCGERFAPARDEAQQSTSTIWPRTERSEQAISESRVVFVIALIVLLIGLFLIAPGIGIAFAILAVPALARTTMVVKRREELRRPVSGWERIVLFFGSVLVMSALLCVVVCTTVGTFCATCLLLAEGLGRRAEGIAISVAGLAGLTAFGFTSWLMLNWAHKRWERHVQGH